MVLARSHRRFTATLLVAALLALATLGVSHAHEHEGADATSCATCVTVHSAPVAPAAPAVAPVALHATLVLPDVAAGPDLAPLVRPSPRGPPAA